MESYENLGGDSGVIAYEIGSDSITVRFRDGGLYLYTNASAGPGNIAQMKSLARKGYGLNAFINTQVRMRYAQRLS
jgi:hypothetical protein